MSFTGRYVIDRIKRSVGKYLRLPVPPYENPNFWEGVYSKMSPTEVFEWADFSFKDLHRYSFKPLDCQSALSILPNEVNPNYYPRPPTEISTTLEETLQLTPDSDEDQPVLILGCGNSQFGDDLLASSLAAPVVQIDVSQRVVENMSLRCHEALQTGDMIILQDDATILSALPNSSVAVVFDKGLIDALFCADAYRQCWEILHTSHRVLQEDGVLVFFSLSRPEFVLRKLMIPNPQDPRHVQQWQTAWSHIECRQTKHAFLYRLTKPGHRRIVTNVVKHTKQQQHHRRKQ